MIGPAALQRLEWQGPLFAARLNRFALMKLGASVAGGPTMRVLRNHAFEGVASILAPFLAYAETPLQVEIGDYDDSLSLPSDPADAALVWLDFARYERLSDEELVAWLLSRLDALRIQSRGPVLVANAPDAGRRAERLNAALDDWASRTPAAAILRLDTIAQRLGDDAFDEVRAALTGTRYAEATCLEAARALAFEALSGFYAVPIKALAVDLDNTLYAGVLGEDGPDGLVLSAGHVALQQAIVQLADRGILVSVISRNEPADVARLFASRSDFPLRAVNVASWQVGWGDKSDGIRAAAAEFNVSPDSFLMIDDNVGELVQAGGAIAGLRLLHAGEDPALTARALGAQPGLQGGGDFAGRAADLSANAERAALAEAALDDDAYLRALKAVITFKVDPTADLKRLAELSRKTNQFNLSLRRLDEVEVARYLAEADRCVVHVQLSDRLADSGSVAALFARREAGTLIIEELCISCRALGRRLEDLMVGEACEKAAVALGADQIAFDYKKGPRNQPALDWLSTFTGAMDLADQGRVEAPAHIFQGRPERPVTIRWTND